MAELLAVAADCWEHAPPAEIVRPADVRLLAAHYKLKIDFYLQGSASAALPQFGSSITLAKQPDGQFTCRTKPTTQVIQADAAGLLLSDTGCLQGCIRQASGQGGMYRSHSL